MGLPLPHPGNSQQTTSKGSEKVHWYFSPTLQSEHIAAKSALYDPLTQLWSPLMPPITAQLLLVPTVTAMTVTPT